MLYQVYYEHLPSFLIKESSMNNGFKVGEWSKECSSITKESQLSKFWHFETYQQKCTYDFFNVAKIILGIAAVLSILSIVGLAIII